MKLSREDITDYASLYVEPQDVVDFPLDGELFCFLSRQVYPDKPPKVHEGWEFNGYGICKDYQVDVTEKPEGKWIWFNFISLATFPPQPMRLKLQPPHIARGTFFTPERTTEMRVLKVNLDGSALHEWQDSLKTTTETIPRSRRPVSTAPEHNQQPASSPPTNILRFPGAIKPRSKRKRTPGPNRAE